MKKVFLISGVIFAFVLSGCASQTPLTYESENSQQVPFWETLLITLAEFVAAAAGSGPSGGGPQIPQIPMVALTPMEMPKRNIHAVRINDNMYSVIGGGTYSINRINDNMYSVRQVFK